MKSLGDFNKIQTGGKLLNQKLMNKIHEINSNQTSNYEHDSVVSKEIREPTESFTQKVSLLSPQT